MIREITSIWNPILNTVCEEVKDIMSSDVQEICDNLIDTLSETSWVGLAAPQIWYNARIFLIRIKPTKRLPDLVDKWAQIIINPIILSYSQEEVMIVEWCLSIPSADSKTQLFAEVKRPGSIEVEYYDRSWVKHSETLDGFEARVFQHEYDHLNGVLFLERLDNLKWLVSGLELERRKKEKMKM